MTPAPAAPALPLLAWPEAVEITRLEEQRRDLRTRIAALRVHSHRRIALEYQLGALTTQQLALESKFRGKP